MTTKRRAWMSWSSGKDSAFALHTMRARADVEIVALLTTLSEAHARVAMHGVRETLLDAQADAAGLPLVKVKIPSPCPNDVYEARMAEALIVARADGVDTVVFGDLFLEDIRAYREEKLATVGMRAEFPLWGRDTHLLAREMIASGVRATLTCVDPRKVPARFAGRAFDDALLADLPASVDPCGENGEFHSFVSACPAFARALDVEVGEIVERDGFVFADVLPLFTACVVLACATVSCSSTRCDDFVTMAFEVGGHSADACALVLSPAAANASSSLELDFAAPTTAATCDGGACTRAACTAVGGVTPSYCARILDAQHDRIELQFEGDSVPALVSLVGRDFNAQMRCGAALVVDRERHSVDCLNVAK